MTKRFDRLMEIGVLAYVAICVGATVLQSQSPTQVPEWVAGLTFLMGGG